MAKGGERLVCDLHRVLVGVRAAPVDVAPQAGERAAEVVGGPEARLAPGEDASGGGRGVAGGVGDPGELVVRARSRAVVRAAA
jgi:hypothetical protein